MSGSARTSCLPPLERRPSARRQGTDAHADPRPRTGDRAAPALGLAALERYRPLVDDWPAFCAALGRPLPPVVWANPRRVTGDELTSLLDAAGFAPRPLGWLAGGLRLAAGSSPGTTLEYAAGLYHVQEEASLLPAELLAARPGERVLDLCAAPGNKTARLAAAMADRGTLVANDRSRGRLGPLRRSLARLGATHVAVTCWDGASYPGQAAGFDRVLADVPCTCEGTSRRNPEVLGRDGAGHRRRLVRLQRDLLAAAVRLTRPGGRIVYSTCTYAPEENEMVVAAALAAAGPGALRVVPARLAGFPGSPGVTRWQGRELPAELAGALRVWPHHADTGGSFVAVLEKVAAEGRKGGESRQPSGASAEEREGSGGEDAPGGGAAGEEWRTRLTSRFGLPPAAFSGLRAVPGGRRRVALAAVGLRPPASPEPLWLGLPAVRVEGVEPKPTTAGAMAFGGAATRNRVAADRRQAETFLRGEPFTLTAAQLGAVTGPGYLLVAWDRWVLGVGRLTAGAPERVESLYPKGWRLAG